VLSTACFRLAVAPTPTPQQHYGDPCFVKLT